MGIRAHRCRAWTMVALLALIMGHRSVVVAPTARLVAVGAETSLHLPLVFKTCPPPSLEPIANADRNGSYTVRWSQTPCQPSHASWELQHDDHAGFGTPIQIPISDPGRTSYSASTPTPGTYYWRVRAFRPGFGWSAWSNVQSVTVVGAEVWVENDTGGTVTVEIVGVEKQRFSTGLHFWRSVAPGRYTVKAWGCGGSLERLWDLDPGKNVMRFYCSRSTASDVQGLAAPSSLHGSMARDPSSGR